ncbi:quinon protein alcohol dehydrogenase-like superfamily [Suillus spraguei]|nr:quinon protein alcohol dehydrogenase-like superfamily [Suillus spraguei]
MAALIPNTTPIRTFEDHGDRVIAVAALHDERMVTTGSYDGVLRLWDLRTGLVLKKMKEHRSRVRALAVSPDRKWIASGDENGVLVAWDGKTGEPLNQLINKVHNGWISSLDFSPNSKVLVSGSSDTTVKLWSTSTWHYWEAQHSHNCGGIVHCVRYSPRIGTHHYDDQLDHGCDYSYCYCSSPIMLITTIHELFNYSLAWTLDGTRLLSGGCNRDDPTIREWCTTTWKQVSDPWKGHFKNIHAISLNSSGTLLASASQDNRVRIWRLSDRQTIAIFKHSVAVNCVTFSADNNHVLSGGVDKQISQWPISEDTLPKGGPKDGLMKEQMTHQRLFMPRLKPILISRSSL